MKHIKKFEKIDNEDIDFLDELIRENPLSEDNDFYIFIGRQDFVETKNGLYKSSIYIENMVRISPDENSIHIANLLGMRLRFQTDSKMYHIWLPKDIRNEVEGKGSGSLEPYIIELINKYKQKGTDEQGKKVYNDVKQRRKNINNYNL
jgi:hypothetical protein